MGSVRLQQILVLALGIRDITKVTQLLSRGKKPPYSGTCGSCRKGTSSGQGIGLSKHSCGH